MRNIILGLFVFLLLTSLHGCGPSTAPKRTVSKKKVAASSADVQQSHSQQQNEASLSVESKPMEATTEPIYEEVVEYVDESIELEVVSAARKVAAETRTQEPRIPVKAVSYVEPPANEQPEFFTELIIESLQREDDKDPEAEVRFTLTRDGDKVVSCVVSKNHWWENPGRVRVKISSKPTDHLGTFDAMDQVVSFGPERPEVLLKLESCEYLVVQPAIAKSLSNSGSSGSLVVEKLHDTHDWHASFAVRGVTNLGNEHELVTTPAVWFGSKQQANSHRWEFSW